jgi:tellurite resistance protein
MTMNVDLFRALAAVAWADQRMDPAEADALLRAARAAHLSPADVAKVEAATKTPCGLDQLGPLSLRGDDAEYAYALACLISGADGRIDDVERATVAKLGDLLSLSTEARERAAIASLSVAESLGLDQSVLGALAASMESTP